MALTSMQVDSAVRDELAEVSEREFGGVALGEALRRLLIEHRVRGIVAAYERLQAEPDQWAEYVDELAEWDATSGDGPTVP
ncbi:MAG: hypothetical protein ACT4QG_15165 [Sporichthyaceae bacterium]